MKRASFKDEELVAAVRELYLKYRGREINRLTAEIRAAGWSFGSINLYPKTVKGILVRGWIERFGWKEELENLEKAEAEERARSISVFDDWLETATPVLRWSAKHHRFICDSLRQITGGDSKRLMLFLPPRHGKSELVTVHYAAWRLITQPSLKIIIACYNQSLANKFSRRIFRLVEDKTKISKRRHAAEEWETAAGGGVKAVGAGAGITGFGGDLIIIDDPVRGRADSRSAVLRDKIWDWYKDDISTRLEPNAPVILIQTRWHDDDLAGRLLKEMEDGGEQWTVVKLPALAEGEEVGSKGVKEVRSVRKEKLNDSDSSTPLLLNSSTDELGRREGEALWPERFTSEHLLTTKRRIGAWSFAALYQQRPLPDGGTLFKAEQFKTIVSKCPSGLRWARGYDLAVSLKESADYTASFRCAIDERTGTLYIADGYRNRIDYPEQKKYVIDRMNAELDTVHGIETALHGAALLQDLRKSSETFGRVLRGVRVDKDKMMRAEAWSCYAEEGRIALVAGPWINDFVDEVCRFTGRGDKHDDQVDAVSIAVQMLRKKNGAIGF